MKMSGILCAVHGCKATKRNKNKLSFFTLPSDAERRKKWAEIIDRPDLAVPDIKIKSHHVCEKHFRKSDIAFIPKLKPDAVPSLHLGRPEPLVPIALGTSTSKSTTTEPHTEEASAKTKPSTKEKKKSGGAGSVGDQSRQPFCPIPDTPDDDDYVLNIFWKTFKDQLKRLPPHRAAQWQEELQELMLSKPPYRKTEPAPPPPPNEEPNTSSETSAPPIEFYIKLEPEDID